VAEVLGVLGEVGEELQLGLAGPAVVDLYLVS